MSDNKDKQIESIMRYSRLIQKQAGRAIRPTRFDGYVNLMNRYGTSKDTTEHYQFQSEPTVPDETLASFYEGNGLFAKIIDAPAEEAVKHGFKLDGITDQKIEDFYINALDELDWEETAMTAIKWARLFGGSIAVMLINDGRGIDEPLDWKNIQSIDDIRVYDRSVIQPDYTTMFNYSSEDPFRTRGSRLGMPEKYDVYSRFGSFTVHESRCLVFQNGILPENCTNSIYQFWGMPEYIRLKNAIRDSELAHSSGPKLLDKSVQAIYKMKDLASELATEDGESKVLRRLQAIDLARGLLSSIVIDSEGEDYDFKTFQFSGVSEIIDTTCNFLSALSSIPQTILFGRSPAGMNATGESDFENYYNFVARIQKRMMKSNLRYLLSILFQAGQQTGEIDDVPPIKLEFNPLWSLSELEQADLEQKRASIQQTRAATAQTYVNMQVLDPSEVRKKLADTEEFDIENILDGEDEEDLIQEYAEQCAEDPDLIKEEGNSPDAAPAATKLPEDMNAEDAVNKALNGQEGQSTERVNTISQDSSPISVGVIVVSEGKVLTGTRHNDFGYGLICGPGGHVEQGETAEQAAVRETEEEFGITPTELIPIGTGPVEPDTGLTPHLFLCTEYEGTPDCVDLEIANPRFYTIEEIERMSSSLFQPFADGITILKQILETPSTNNDGSDKEKSAFPNISEKTIDKSVGSCIVKSKESSDQKGPGAPKGNTNASKGHRVKSTAQERKSFRKKLKGTNTVTGTVIDKVHTHACDRMAERKISAKDVKDVLETAPITYPGNKGDRTCYQKGKFRIVVDNTTNQVRTVINLEDDDE